MVNTKKVLLAAGVLVLVLAFAGAGWYFATRQTDNGETPATSPTTTMPSSPSSEPSTTEPSKSYTVKVFFSKHPESDDDPGMTFPVERTTSDLGVATFALTELLKGPTTSEAARGYFTTARLRPAESTCAGKDFKLTINNGVARLTFCKPFDHVGSISDGQAESAIKATLDQFDSVSKVIILNSNGNCEFDLSGENRCLQ